MKTLFKCFTVSKPVKYVITTLWVSALIVLLTLTFLSADQLETCDRNIYGLLIALYFVFLANPFPDHQYHLVFFLEDIFDRRAYFSAITSGFIGSIGLSYMIDIEKNTPDCFSGSYHPKWLTWVFMGFCIIAGAAYTIISALLSITVLILKDIPALFTKIKNRFSNNPSKKVENIISTKTEVKDESLASLIKGEILRGDLTKHDFDGYFEYLEKSIMMDDRKVRVGITGKEWNELEKIKGKRGELKHIARSKFVVPIEFESDSTEEMLKILKHLDLEILGLPLFTAWIDMQFEKCKREPIFYCFTDTMVLLLTTSFILIDERDLIYATIFIISLNSLISCFRILLNINDPQTLKNLEALHIPRYICVIFYMILIWTEVASDSKLFTFVASFTLIFVWAEIISKLEMFDSVRKFLILLIEIFKDIIPFLTILLASVLGFCFAFHVYNKYQINESTGEYNTFGHSLFGVLSLTLGGFDLSDDSPFNVHYILTGAGAVFLNIVMLSILIALMGETQSRVSNFSDGASNLMKIDMMLAKFKSNPMFFDSVVKKKKDVYDYIYWYDEKTEENNEIGALKEEIVEMKKMMAEMYDYIKKNKHIGN